MDTIPGQKKKKRSCNAAQFSENPAQMFSLDPAETESLSLSPP